MPYVISRVSPGTFKYYGIKVLAEAMYPIARLLEDEGDAFAEAFEPEPPPAETDNAANEVQALFAELEQMETERAATP